MPEMPEGTITLSQLESSLMTIDERVATPPVNAETYKRHLREFLSPVVIEVNDLFDDLYGYLEDGNENLNSVIEALDVKSRDLFRWATMLMQTREHIFNFRNCRTEPDLRTVPRVYLSTIVGLYEYVNEENKNILLPFLDRMFASFILAWGGQVECGSMKTFVITIEEMAMFPLYIKKLYSAGSKMALASVPLMFSKIDSAADRHFASEVANERNRTTISYLFWDYASDDEEEYSGERFDGKPFAVTSHGDLVSFLVDIAYALLKLINANRIIMLAELSCPVSQTVSAGVLKKCRDVLSEECYQGTFSIGDVKTTNIIRFLATPPVL